MNGWQLDQLQLEPKLPEVLASTDEGRAVALELEAGSALSEHVVHERAWVYVVRGKVEFETPTGQRLEGAPGFVAEFAPGERHSLRARTPARLLLLLTPWPGHGHPGGMSLQQKLYARSHANRRR